MQGTDLHIENVCKPALKRVATGRNDLPVAGRLNETWFQPTREGVYYGQCSELYGAHHAFKPFTMQVVSQQRFGERIDEAQATFGSNSTPTETRVAVEVH